MFLVVCMLAATLSVTAFAEGEVDGNSTQINQDDNIQDKKDTRDNEGNAEPIELTEDNARIEFVEEDFSCVYTGKEIKPAIRVILTVEKTEEPDGEPGGDGVPGETDDSSAPEGLEILTGDDENIETEEICLDDLGEGLYTVEYQNNVNATVPGTEDYAKIIVTGVEEKGFTGTIEADFVIEPKALDNATLSVAATKYVYDGKAKNPAVTLVSDGITLENGKDYTVTYSGNNEVGTASVTVTGKGNYTGTKKAAYSIVLGSTTVTTKAAYNKITVSWTKVAGASGYDVLRSTTSGKGYKTVKTVTSGSTASYADSGVTFNKTYYYIIKPYRMVGGKKVYADQSAQKSQKVMPATPTISKVSRKSATSLKITWNKVNGASGYALYRSTSENGKYTKIATIKKGKTVSYTDKKKSCGKTYYYKVRAYRTVKKKNYYSSYSAAKAGCATPGKVSWNMKKASYNATSITLKWKKVPEATGYVVYRSTSKNGTYEAVKTITKNSTLKWKNSGLANGTNYYYKIRSYKKVGKQQVFGSYSSVYTKSVGGWRYEGGYKLYYNGNGKLVKDVSKLIGKQSSYVIKVNKRKNTVTVYAKDGKNGYIIPVKSFICSTGAATPIGTFKTPQKLRWHTLDGPSYGQWCTRITGSILFHSVWYYQPKNTTLSVAQYNKLGTQASHGCVRLTAGDAKWIYDNCKLKTKVIIYNSNDPGPLGKPTAHKLKSWHTWDPTDPNMKSKCAKKGCH